MSLLLSDRQTPIGKQIDAYLTNSKDLDDHVIHLLFSANRWEQRYFFDCISLCLIHNSL